MQNQSWMQNFLWEGLPLIFISGAGGLGGTAPQMLLGIQFC